MKKFDFSCVKSLSDDTFVFLITFEKGCTVQDVIDLALSRKEWGTIYIVEEGGSRFHSPRIEYSNGKIVKQDDINHLRSGLVCQISSNGGWGNMDYDIRIPKGEDDEIN